MDSAVFQLPLPGQEDILSLPREARCSALLELVRPWMPREPEQGWLSWIYHWLTLGLYPDETAQIDPDAAEGALRYVQALEWTMCREKDPFDPMTDLISLSEEQIAVSRVAEEYRRFQDLVRGTHLHALLRIGRACMPFDTASHIIGVHNIALHAALLADQAGLPVDLALVSGASFAHDIGKFGCRGADARRIPYLHYYYTWTWLERHGLAEIGHIAANHSTWDLEFENLPIESLLLIYADFRVRGHRGQNGREIMSIYSLAESRDMIFSKLADMTPEKQQRYQSVYCKLRDFEEYLRSKGVSPMLDHTDLEPEHHTDPALLSASQAYSALRRMTFENNVRLMHTITTDRSFDQLLEQARSERTPYALRTYLRLLNEYSTYLSRPNKQKILGFLYELLMHTDGDVRRRASQIMGQILANSGPSYRKELPANAPKSALAPAMMAILDQTTDIWDSYIDQCLNPDRKITSNHALRISNSLKDIAASLFACSGSHQQTAMLKPLLKRLRSSKENRFSVAGALQKAAPAAFEEEDLTVVQTAAIQMLTEDIHHRIAALQLLEHLAEPLDSHLSPELISALQRTASDPEFAVCYQGQRLLRRFMDDSPEPPQPDVGQLYLSNLKNAVHWTVKLIQIDALCCDAVHHPQNAFHTAMHLSNLLSVSEQLAVREHAGCGLLRIAEFLAVDQRNEIAVDLLRELENGRDQISRFIPPFLGKLLCTLPRKEFEENLVFLENMVRSGVERSARAAGYTLGEILNTATTHSHATDQVLGMLITDIAHYKDSIHQTALTALCRDVISADRLTLEARRDIFLKIGKKLLCLLSEPRNNQLTFFNRAAMLNHLYRFMVRCEVELGEFPVSDPLPVAFFPGTFDPFSTGHKRIVEEIRTRGFEVYLAIDEFSWSKRTLAKLRRRRIATMSVADMWDVYIFPDEIPVNIAIPADLALLKSLFPGRRLYLAAGSDVIRNASAYRSRQPGSAAEYNHVIFHRDEESTDAEPLEKIIHGDLILLSLPSYYETVSSTRIREYVDKNLDISMLVDPIVQSYIYEYGLYLRTPQFKQVLEPEDLYFVRYNAASMPSELRYYTTGRSAVAVGLYNRFGNRLLGWACGHTAAPSELLEVVEDIDAASYVRRHTSGRILVVDAVHCDQREDTETCRRVINELLARSLAEDHTYSLCRLTEPRPTLLHALEQLGFVPIPHRSDLYYTDMRAPMILIQDIYLSIKQPHRDDPQVKAVISRCRPLLRQALTALFPGCLVLAFDTETLNQALLYKVQQHNHVLDVPPGIRHLGNYMCVPYGKILSETVVPNTVTKTLHVEKRYDQDISSFTVEEYPGYSSLVNQIRTIKSFRRPVLLVDDLLHKGYRIDNLDPLFKAEGVDISRIIVGVMSGRGKDLMQMQDRSVDSEYFIPNLHYWFTESGLYPFLGGDSIHDGDHIGKFLPSVNMILPYYYPKYIYDGSPDTIRHLSQVCLENAAAILEVLEQQHQQIFHTALTLHRLGEAIHAPRLPDKGRLIRYDLSVPPSAYIHDDLSLLRRIKTD